MKTVRNSASSHSRNKFRGMSWSNVYCRGPLCNQRGNVDSQGNRAGRLPSYFRSTAENIRKQRLQKIRDVGPIFSLTKSTTV